MFLLLMLTDADAPLYPSGSYHYHTPKRPRAQCQICAFGRKSRFPSPEPLYLPQDGPAVPAGPALADALDGQQLVHGAGAAGADFPRRRVGQDHEGGQLLLAGQLPAQLVQSGQQLLVPRGDGAAGGFDLDFAPRPLPPGGQAVGAVAAADGGLLAEIAQQLPPQAPPGGGVVGHLLQTGAGRLGGGVALLRGQGAVLLFLLDEEAGQPHVARGVQQHAPGRRAVPPGAARLLVVALEVAGHIVVDHHPHVGLVDAHAEGVGGHHHLHPVVEELFLVSAAVGRVHLPVVGPRRKAGPLQRVDGHGHLPHGGAVDDGGVVLPCFCQQPEQGAVLAAFMTRVVGIYVVACFMMLFVSALNVLDYLYGRNPNIPLRGVFQAGKVIVYLLAALVVISILISKKPMYVITGLSAAAAVFMLIFKDPILGFAAGIQLASNRLLKIGDWITMPSHGADGTVTDITLTTVRVQNFDNTIINIPAYDLVSRPFQNWNGMVQSGARRIKRAINIDVDTIKFLDKDLLSRLEKIQLISDYLKEKITEVRAFNEGQSLEESLLNGRHLTNVGTFRAYALAYLQSLPTIDHGQTCMVRQLDPTTAGLPLEIYCFTATTDWGKYENIQSDVFDHLYSVMPEFDLYPYQQPAGRNVSMAARVLLQDGKESSVSAGA